MALRPLEEFLTSGITGPMARILCIEDSAEFQIYLSSILVEHTLIHASTISEALQTIEQGANFFDLVLLDISLPDGNGMKVLPKIKEAFSDHMIPFIIISSDSDVITKVAAFGVGADDYISKPPETSELKARIEAKLRWSQSLSSKQKLISFLDLAIDLEKMSVEIINETGARTQLDLTPYEFKILKLLVSRPGQVFSREHIIDRVWGGKYLTSRTVDTHVSHLRTKISSSSVQVETVLGSGYKISKKNSV